MEQQNNPTFGQSLITFVSIVFVIGFGLFVLKTSLHSLMLICLIIAGLSAWLLSQNGFKPIREAMNSGISRAFTALYIFVLIGVLIAAFIQSGTVAALVYYGLKFISPLIFLPAGLLLCSFMSLATGTSWGTVGTAGVVLMGIGGVMGVPLPLVAGMVISGAVFGDKMSPVSDTTNLAAMSSDTNLYSHIKSMSLTTGPAYIIALLIFGFLGAQSTADLPAEKISELLTALDSSFNINILALLPFVVMLVLSFRKAPAEIAMLAAAATAIFLAIVIQGQSFSGAMNALYSGGKFNTGVEMLDGLFGRGGISSMMWTLSLALMALALGGILTTFGFLKSLIVGLLTRVKRTGSLVATTIVSCLFGNMSMGEAYMSIILGGQLFGDAYDERKIDRSVLSRSVEEGATLTVPLIPWTTGGAFFATTLGISTIEYAPWALLCWINPILSIIFAYLGIAIFKTKKRKKKTSSNRSSQTNI